MKETTVTGYSERFSIFSFVKSQKYSSFIKYIIQLSSVYHLLYET